MDDKAVIKRMVSSDTTLTQEDVDVLKYVANKYGFPLFGIDLIPTKTGNKVYINMIGLDWLVQNDKRLVREISTECLIDPYDNEKGRAKYRATVRFANNSIFRADGSASPGSVKGGKCTRDDVNSMAQTRALRKAMLLATASSLILHDNDVIQEWEVEQMARVGGNIPDFEPNIVQMEQVLETPHTITGLVKGMRKDGGGEWIRAKAVLNGQQVEYFLPTSIARAVQWFLQNNPGESWDCIVYREEGNNGYFRYKIDDAPSDYESPVIEHTITELDNDDIPF